MSNESKETKIKFSLVIILIIGIVILILGYFMYRINEEKNLLRKENDILNDKIQNLDTQINNYEQKINSIANTISNSSNGEKNQIKSDSSMTNESNKEDVKSNLIGEWKVEKATLNNEQVELRDVFGSSISNGVGSLYLEENGSFKDYIASVTSSEFDNDAEGTYTISENIITLNCKSNKKKTLKYSKGDNKITYLFGEYSFTLGKSSKIAN